MAKYSIKRAWMNLVEKLNPAQRDIADVAGPEVSSDYNYNYKGAFDKINVINRGVNIIVNACASLDYDIKDKVHDGNFKGIRAKQLHTLLNYRPNPYQSIQDFRSNLFTDFILEGNAFVYYDGAFLYHLPAVNTSIVPDEKTFIKKYEYTSNGRKAIEFAPFEIAHFKDLSSSSVYRGTSRLISVLPDIATLYKMKDFQTNFFENGAVFNIAITSDNPLSTTVKERTLAYWLKTYNAKSGGKKPVILDNGMKPHPLTGASTFRELDFDTSIKTNKISLLEALGVPPVLLDGGNQANIAPNLRLMYLETILPITRKFISAMELMTGYDIDIAIGNVTALQPELKDISSYHSTLVNTGVETPNEAREALRLPKDTDPESDKLRIPANIAGSAANPSTGGAPKKPITPQK